MSVSSFFLLSLKQHEDAELRWWMGICKVGSCETVHWNELKTLVWFGDFEEANAVARIHGETNLKQKGSKKAIPLQAWTGPEVSMRLRLPDFKTISTWRWWGCQPYAPAAFTHRKYSWYSFLLETESTPGWNMSMKNSNGNFGNRTHVLPACSAVPQPTAPPLHLIVWPCNSIIMAPHFFAVLSHWLNTKDVN